MTRLELRDVLPIFIICALNDNQDQKMPRTTVNHVHAHVNLVTALLLPCTVRIDSSASKVFPIGGHDLRCHAIRISQQMKSQQENRCTSTEKEQAPWQQYC